MHPLSPLLLLLPAALATTTPNTPTPDIQAATLTPGRTVPSTWTPTAAEAVTLSLRRGAEDVLTIAENTPNDGLHTWTVPLTLPAGGEYAISIADAAAVRVTPRGVEANRTVAAPASGTGSAQVPVGTGTAGVNGTRSGNGTYTGGRGRGNGTTLYAPKQGGEEEKEEEEEEDAAVGVRGSVLAVIVAVVGAGVFLA